MGKVKPIYRDGKLSVFLDYNPGDVLGVDVLYNGTSIEHLKDPDSILEYLDEIGEWDDEINGARATLIKARHRDEYRHELTIHREIVYQEEVKKDKVKVICAYNLLNEPIYTWKPVTRRISTPFRIYHKVYRVYPCDDETPCLEIIDDEVIRCEEIDYIVQDINRRLMKN